MMTAKAIAALGLLIGLAGAAPPSPLPADALVIFGSRYCAPCVAELKELPKISQWRGARPMVVAWIDKEPPPAIDAFPATRAVEWREARRMLMASSAGASLAVPLVVATNGQGKVCGATRQPLTRALVKDLTKAC
ncbi:MAG: hypothetical protein ACKOUT_11960 [Novosphingobium sp.]